MDHTGIDVHKKDSHICIVSEDGELLEHRIRTEAGRVAELLGPRPRARILLESATESEWAARCLPIRNLFNDLEAFPTLRAQKPAVDFRRRIQSHEPGDQ